MGPLVPTVKDKSFNFSHVTFKSRSDRNKHGAVLVVESGEYGASKGKENSVFQFGESSIGCSNSDVQTFEDGDVQRKKPPDRELGGFVNLMVELSATIMGIVLEPDADLLTDALLSTVEVMDDDDIGNNEISC